MSYKHVIGIDPGAGGAIVSLDMCKEIPTGLEVIKMPSDILQIRDHLAKLALRNRGMIIMLEQVVTRPQDGDVRGKVMRIAKMMQNYERLKSAIQFLEIPFIEVHPQVWQKQLGLTTKKDASREERKRRYKRYASTRYPDMRVTLWNADALCIMEYARLMLISNPNWISENIHV